MSDERSLALAALFGRMVAEMRGQPDEVVEVRPESVLDRDLGLDSLARVELLHRIEAALEVRLDERTLAEAETFADVLAAVEGAGAGPAAAVAGDGPLALPGRPGSVPDRARTLVDVLDWHLERHPERPFLFLYPESDGDPVPVTFGDLSGSARRTAAGLAARDLGVGGTAAILLPTGRDYFDAFFGIQLAGGIPVPLYPPVRMSQLEDHLERQIKILDNAGVSVLVTFDRARPVARFLEGRVRSLRHIVTLDDLRQAEVEPVRPALKGSDIAFLQYTSGSTGTPKGVVLTHDNLLANMRAMVAAVEATPDDVFVSWLPLYHDMGLIGACLSTMYASVPIALMSPLRFLTRPERWLQAISRHRGTLSAAPNFAYELCLSRIDDAALEGVDLSSWRVALNGAEPVSPRTIERFTERFAPYGFRPEAMSPVYGLAECSVGLLFPRPSSSLPVIDTIEREAFSRSGEAVPAAADDEHALRFVGCGEPLVGHEVRIVDPAGREVGERVEGRLQFRGPSATSGYYRNDEATAGLRDGDWLDSGDEAYVVGGQVFLTGRVKDIIIRGGRNIYPHEVEEAVGEVEGVRKGCVAVFGAADAGTGTERLVVLAETRATDREARQRIEERIRGVAHDVLGSPPDEVVLAGPRIVPKTSSGKLRRSAARDLYQAGRIDRPARSVWRQLAGLQVASLRGRLRSARRRLGEAAYALWTWLVFIGLLTVGSPFIVFLPGLGRRWSALRIVCRLFVGLSRMRLTVEGLDRLPARQSVLVVNHSSYLDPVVLIAALPGPYSFVAKRELEDSRLMSLFLRRVGVRFVERFDREQASEDARAIVAAAVTGASLALFPEGTFFRRPGLLPFRMGAFVVAAEAGLPVVPISLAGTRSVLRDEQWFPRRAPMRLTVGGPIEPDGSDWSAAVRLRDAARETILARCGEPDLEREPVAV